MTIIITFITALLSWTGVPAVDDGPCPWEAPVALSGDRYDHDLYRRADGTIYGIAVEEDSCIFPFEVPS